MKYIEFADELLMQEISDSLNAVSRTGEIIYFDKLRVSKNIDVDPEFYQERQVVDVDFENEMKAAKVKNEFSKSALNMAKAIDLMMKSRVSAEKAKNEKG